MSVKEALNGSRVREVVVDSSQRSLESREARVDSKAGAIDAVVHLGVMILEGLDAFVDFFVPLPQRVEFLERRRDHAPNVAQRLAMLREAQGEREVGVAKNGAIGEGVDELEAAVAAKRHGAWRVGDGVGECVVLVWDVARGVRDHIFQRRRPVVLAEDVFQVLLAKSTEHLVGFQAQLPARTEAGDVVELAASGQLPLTQLADELRQELTGRLPLVHEVRRVIARDQRLELIFGEAEEDVLADLVLRDPPLRQQEAHLRVLWVDLSLLARRPVVQIARQQALQAQRPLHRILQMLLDLDLVVLVLFCKLFFHQLFFGGRFFSIRLLCQELLLFSRVFFLLDGRLLDQLLLGHSANTVNSMRKAGRPKGAEAA
mmetsp:Transcript_112359/g.317549  ORF Transcript_112359/g.317549 Transcript_112359/m.317549 type:complete len:373 (-) Transcript_112359:18-1136(-)